MEWKHKKVAKSHLWIHLQCIITLRQKSVVRTFIKDVTFIVPLKFKSDCFLRRHVTFASAVYLYMFTKQITSLKLMTCLAKNTAIEILVFAKSCYNLVAEELSEVLESSPTHCKLSPLSILTPLTNVYVLCVFILSQLLFLRRVFVFIVLFLFSVQCFCICSSFFLFSLQC